MRFVFDTLCHLPAREHPSIPVIRNNGWRNINPRIISPLTRY
ncbi:regulatory SdiA domain protein [Enterobacter hormaechei]|nr:regulatory SdiA domain protein [Enterobacter hormaechei]